MKSRGFAILLIMVMLLTFTQALSAQTRYELQAPYNTNLRILIAKSQIGIREETNQSQILNYLRSVNINRMASWCAAFQYWVYDSACRQIKVVNSLPKSAVANSYYDFGKRNGLRTTYQARPGDLIVWKSDSWSGHIGMVIRQLSKQTVETIEGNTSSKSVRTGGAVESKVRSIYHPIGKLKVRGLIGFANGR